MTDKVETTMFDEPNLQPQPSDANTGNPQSIESTNLQPQQTSLQGSQGPGVLGISSVLEQSSQSALRVEGVSVNPKANETSSSQVSPNSGTGTFAGKASWVYGGGVALVIVVFAVLAYNLVSDRSR